MVAESVLFLHVINAVSDSVFQKVFIWLRYNISFKKVLKRLYYYKWKTWQKLFPNLGLKFLCVLLYHELKNPFQDHKFKIIVSENDWVAILQIGTNWKFIVPQRVINWDAF